MLSAHIITVIISFHMPILKIASYIGASVNPALPSIEYQWWLREEEGICHTVTRAGDLLEQNCDGNSLEDDVFRKPLCQFGNCL